MSCAVPIHQSSLRHSRQLAAVEFERVLRILEHVTGKNQDNHVVWFYKPLPDEFLQTGKGNSRSRFTAHTIRSYLGLGFCNFLFADLFACAARRLQDADRFFPGSGTPDT